MMGRVKELYPLAPGYKELTTSRDAAVAIAGRAETLRTKVLACLKEAKPGYGFTADEIASFLDTSVLSIRPRFSELLKLEKIERTGERRANASGAKAQVWRVKVTS
jgi:hypothetical protein